VILKEAVRRSFLTLLKSGNVASALATLDPSADMPSGIKLLNSTPEMQAEAQVALAKESFGILFGEADTTEFGDVLAMAAQLPAAVKNDELTELCQCLSQVVQAETLDDATVQHALDKLMDNPDVHFKAVLSYPRARALLDGARRMVLQRSVDASLQGELTCIRGNVDALVWAGIAESAEQVLVNCRFNASLLGKARLRFEGLMDKASAKMKLDRTDDVAHIKSTLKEHCERIRHTQIRIFWDLVAPSLRFLGVYIFTVDLNTDEQLRVHDGLQERCFALCVTKSTEFGLSPLLGQEASELHDATLGHLAKFKAALSDMVQNLEKGEIVQIFGGIAEKKFWEVSMEANVFDTSSPSFHGVVHVDDLVSGMVPIYQGYVDAATVFFDQTLCEQAWFANMLRALSDKKKPDPWQASLKATMPELGHETLEKMQKDLATACEILDVTSNVNGLKPKTVTKAGGVGLVRSWFIHSQTNILLFSWLMHKQTNLLLFGSHLF